jgi:hypothetical protein
MKKLDDVSTRELLETLRRRGASAAYSKETAADGAHLRDDAAHLVSCLGDEVLNYPYPASA